MQGKHSKPLYWNKKRVVCAVLSAVLLLACLSFSAMAWLQYEKKTNVQVFKGTSLEIGFSGDKDTTYPLIPGKTYQLTGNAVPKVTLPANSINCYVYVLCEFYWYDLKYDVSHIAVNAEKQEHLYGYPLSTMYRETDVGHDPFNDTYRPNRQGNPDTDFGYIDYFGFDSITPYNTDSHFQNGVDIRDENGTVIGRRYLFGYRTRDNKEFFEKSTADRFLNVLEGNDSNCTFTVNEFITKEQAAAIATNGKAPKMVFTGYAVQSDGLTRNDATTMVTQAIQNGNAQAGLLE